MLLLKNGISEKQKKNIFKQSKTSGVSLNVLINVLDFGKRTQVK
jgi:hypothetical protein